MSSLDLVIIAAYLVAVVAAGAFFSLRQKTTRQYFLGGRNVPWWAIAASIVATETSTISFISVPGILYAYKGNFTFLQLVFGYMLGRIVISILFIPAYFKGELLTVYDLLRRRFGGLVKGIAASLFLAARTAGDGIRLLLTALVLSAVWRVYRPEMTPDKAVVWAILGLGIVMILFTLWGGVEAVIWIEVVQLLIYVGGAIAAGVVLADKVPGGLSGAFALGAKYGKTVLIDSSGVGYTTFWAGLIGGCFLTMSTHGTDQYLVQRYLCTDRPARAAAALLTSGVIVLLQFIGFLTIGLLLFAFYAPYRFPEYRSVRPVFPFHRPDMVFPDFITHHLPAGLAGLVIAAILAAAMSSSLNAIAATTINDILRPMSPPRDDRHWLRMGRILTVVAGLLQIGVAFFVRRSPTSALDKALGIAALFNGPILGVFLLGALTRRAGRIAALAGLVAGLGMILCVRFLTHVPWPWYTAIGSLTTLGVGALVGFILPQDEDFEPLEKPA